MKGSLRVLVSSESPHHFTPPEVLAPIRAFSPIAFDPFGNAESLVDARIVVTPPGDSLVIDWPKDGSTFANPPYGRALARCARKIAEQAARGVEVLTLVPARVGTKWWRVLSPLCWCAWNGRITFLECEAQWRARVAREKRLTPAEALALQPRRRVGALVANDAAPFDAALCYHGPRPAQFAAHFSAHGVVYFATEARQRGHARRPVGRPRLPVPSLVDLREALRRGQSLREMAEAFRVPRARLEQPVRQLRGELERVRIFANFQTDEDASDRGAARGHQ